MRADTPAHGSGVEPLARAGVSLAERDAMFADNPVDGGLGVELPRAFPVSLPDLLRAIEDRYIDRALSETGGNRQAAATLLGLQRTTLVEKLRRREQHQARTWTQTASRPA
jgi:sigma-54 specific flagellar transcriptional regulator A